MTKRTVIRVPVQSWAFIEPWLASNSFTPQQSSPQERLYQNGSGLLIAPTMLLVRQVSAEALQLEVWVRCNLFTRIASLFLLPAEMGVESGGWRGWLPRQMSRDLFNGLLRQLGLPQIP
jgi:hypothetical protein